MSILATWVDEIILYRVAAPTPQRHRPAPLPIDGHAYRRRRNRRTK